MLRKHVTVALRDDEVQLPALPCYCECDHCQLSCSKQFSVRQQVMFAEVALLLCLANGALCAPGMHVRHAPAATSYSFFSMVSAPRPHISHGPVHREEPYNEEHHEEPLVSLHGPLTTILRRLSGDTRVAVKSPRHIMIRRATPRHAAPRGAMLRPIHSQFDAANVHELKLRKSKVPSFRVHPRKGQNISTSRQILSNGT